jgi:uncharacterized protein
MMLLAAAALAFAAPGPGPSFDCARAAAPAERMICADPRLAAYDRALAALYRAEAARAGRARAAATQRQWLAERNRCATPDCLLERHHGRFLDLAAADNIDAQMLRSETDRDAFLQIAPIGGGWYMFYATDIWVYPGGGNANTAESGGVFRLAGTTGAFESDGCRLRFQPLPGRRWRVTESGPDGDRCAGGLNTSHTGIYGPEK